MNLPAGGAPDGLNSTSKPESLDQEADHIIEEARMILPGIQALFGFQLIAVFSPRFATALTPSEQCVHLAAISSVVVAIALIMTPAAYHRQAEPDTISRYFVELASGLLTLALLPLLLGIALDLFLISQVIVKNVAVSLAVALAAFGILLGLWYIFPRVRIKQRSARLARPH
jgi:Family of unknown function (DUF6328)